jgi:hypothetical protein
VEGQKTGYGEYFYKNGDNYKGQVHSVLHTPMASCDTPLQFFEGQFHGLGVYSWSNGASYDGDHVKDQRTGFGIMTYPDGAAFSGIWEDGVHKEFRDTRWAASTAARQCFYQGLSATDDHPEGIDDNDNPSDHNDNGGDHYKEEEGKEEEEGKAEAGAAWPEEEAPVAVGILECAEAEEGAAEEERTELRRKPYNMIPDGNINCQMNISQ